jgi:hypothetical protein
MFQVHTPDDGSIFLSSSVYLDRSHSFFPFFFFFVLLFLLCFIIFSFPFPFFSFFRRLPMHKSRQEEKRSECQLMTQFAAQPLREFPGNYHGKYASSSVGRELNKYTRFRKEEPSVPVCPSVVSMRPKPSHYFPGSHLLAEL